MSIKGKKVLVTGAAGFIGSNLTERLVKDGAEVRAYIHYNALGTRGWLDHSEYVDDVEFVSGDIADADSVQAAMEDIDIVFHLAALIGIPYSYNSPRSYVKTNIEGTLNVLQSARKCNVSRVLHTSTSEVYGTALTVPISEEHPLQGQSPYSATKIAADKIAESYHLSFDLPVVTIRPFNTFGPRQSQRAVIPTIITQILQGSEIKVGNLTSTRDFNFVSNTVDGFIQGAICDDAIGRTFNLGTGKEISIASLINLISEITGKKIEIKQEDERLRPSGSEVDRLLADSQLANELLNWEPRVSLREGLAQTIDWLEQNIKMYQVGKYTV